MRAYPFLSVRVLEVVDTLGVPLATQAESLTAISIPGEQNTLPAAETAQAARSVGLAASEAETAQEALAAILAAERNARVVRYRK